MLGLYKHPLLLTQPDVLLPRRTDPYTLFYLEIIAFQFAELRRWQDFKKPGCMSEQYFLGLESVLGNTTGNPSYPGVQAHGYTRLSGTLCKACSSA